MQLKGQGLVEHQKTGKAVETSSIMSKKRKQVQSSARPPRKVPKHRDIYEAEEGKDEESNLRRFDVSFPARSSP